MEPQQQIEICSKAFYICFAIMAAGFGVAAFVFFKYKIPDVFSLMTGFGQKKTIKKMMKNKEMLPAWEQEENFEDVKCRFEIIEHVLITHTDEEI